jgi:SAM-dependent methyltransferase
MKIKGKFVIKPHNTAVNNGVASGVKNAIKSIDKEAKILDYGSGKLRNSRYLLSKGFNNVSILDKQVQLDRLEDEEKAQFNVLVAGQELEENNYDVIFCNFVLNVIPNLIERNEIISNIHHLFKEGGKAIFEVRKADDIFKAKYITEYLDGYIVGKNSVKTFQKPYELEELEDILERHFKVIERKKYSNSIVVTVQKGTEVKTEEKNKEVQLKLGIEIVA